MKSSLLKSIVFLAALLSAVMVLVSSPMPSSAATSGIKLESSVRVSFPVAMIFEIRAESQDEVIDLRLHYRVERENYAMVTSETWPEFQPERVVETSWLWDMRKGGLPPGAVVEYWWTAEDAAGRQEITSPMTVYFDDDRYPWLSQVEGDVTLLWYVGSRTFADELMDAAQQALQRIEQNTGASLAKPVRIYIYSSAEDMRGALLFPQEWTGGLAFVDFNIIIIGVSEDILSWGKRAMAHELTHAVIGQMTFNNYGAGLPTWLNEGLATYGEGEVTQKHAATVVEMAISGEKLISVRSLASPFSALREEANISYAESYSVVEFMMREYGRDRILALLNVFGEGSTYDDALRKVYGFDQDELDTAWRASLGL
jgi:hypothetical protein